jgi:hypothetical protein
MPAPEWTQSISNETICNFFYAFFVIYAVLTAITVIGFLIILTTVKMPLGQAVAQGFYGVIVISLGTTMMIYHYLIFDRALKSS